MTEPVNTRVRLTPDERREIILTAATKVARDAPGGVMALTMESVASACQPPTSKDTVKHYWTMPDLRQAVTKRL